MVSPELVDVSCFDDRCATVDFVAHCTDKKSLSAAAPEEKVNSGHGLLQQKAGQEESAREANPNEDGGFQER